MFEVGEIVNVDNAVAVVKNIFTAKTTTGKIKVEYLEDGSPFTYIFIYQAKKDNIGNLLYG